MVDPLTVGAIAASLANLITDYLYACELMVQCKEAAVRVSPQTWEAIEGRMLRVEG